MIGQAWVLQPQPAPTLFRQDFASNEEIMADTHKTNEVSINEMAAKRFLLTPRDRQMIRWVHDARAATREQLQRLFFSAASKSRCQHRLTVLYRHRFLDKLPRRSASEPDVYYMSRRAFRGLRELRGAGLSDAAPTRLAPLRVPHILAISSCRAALTAACDPAGYQLDFWIDEMAIAPYTEAFGFIPDGYFQIRRSTNEGERRAAFFLEVERSGKSKRALTDRFAKYARFYYDGHYERLFGTKALRTLFLIASDYGMNPMQHIETCVRLCEKAGATFFRFAALDDVLQLSGTDLLLSPTWRQPGTGDLWPLFTLG